MYYIYLQVKNILINSANVPESTPTVVGVTHIKYFILEITMTMTHLCTFKMQIIKSLFPNNYTAEFNYLINTIYN